MQLDDELCICFHVTKRKVVNYLRIEQPSRVAQLSHCQGAGTGCGWCRPYLQKLFDAWQSQQSVEQLELPDSATYQAGRSSYRRTQES